MTTTFLIAVGIIVIAGALFAWMRLAGKRGVARRAAVGYPGGHAARPYPGDHPSVHEGGGPSGG